MSYGICPHCGAPLPRDLSKIYCDYCQSAIEERITALTSFPTTNPTPQIGTTKSPDFEQEEESTVSHWLLEKIIMLAIGLFIIAFILPPALTATTTSALSSVNPAVLTVFEVLVPIIALMGVVLLVFKHTMEG